MDGLERLGVAIVGSTRERLQRLQIVHETCDQRPVGACSREAPNRLFGRLSGGLDHILAAFDDRMLDLVEPRTDIFVLACRRRPGKVRCEICDLGLQAPDQILVEAGLKQRRFELARHRIHARFERTDRPFVRWRCRLLLEPRGEISETCVHRLDEAGVMGGIRTAAVEA